MAENNDGFISCIRVFLRMWGVCAGLLTPIRGFFYFLKIVEIIEGVLVKQRRLNNDQ